MKKINIILFAIFLFSCFPDKSRINARFDKFVGLYVINYYLTNQNRKILDSTKIKEVYLELFSDSTFKFTNNINFFCSDTGRWVISNGGFEEWNELRFIGCKEYFQFGELDSKNNIAIIIGSKPNLGGIDYFYFQKKQ